MTLVSKQTNLHTFISHNSYLDNQPCIRYYFTMMNDIIITNNKEMSSFFFCCHEKQISTIVH